MRNERHRKGSRSIKELTYHADSQKNLLNTVCSEHPLNVQKEIWQIGIQTENIHLN